MYYMFHLHEKVMQLQAKLSPRYVCTTTVYIHAQMKSVTLCHCVHKVIQIQYPNIDLKNNSLADAEVQYPCWVFFF